MSHSLVPCKSCTTQKPEWSVIGSNNIKLFPYLKLPIASRKPLLISYQAYQCLYDLPPALLPDLIYYHLCASLHYPSCFSGPLYFFSLWEKKKILKDVFFVFFLENSLHIFFTWFSPCHTSERSNISCRGIYFSTSLAKIIYSHFSFHFTFLKALMKRQGLSFMLTDVIIPITVLFIE